MVAGDFDMRDAIGAAPFLYFIFFILFSGSGLVVVGAFDIRDASGAAVIFLFFIFYFVFQAVDWWSLGILIYEMLVGLPPFYNRNTRLAYEKVLSLLALLVLVLVHRVN